MDFLISELTWQSYCHSCVCPSANTSTNSIFEKISINVPDSQCSLLGEPDSQCSQLGENSESSGDYVGAMTPSNATLELKPGALSNSNEATVLSGIENWLYVVPVEKITKCSNALIPMITAVNVSIILKDRFWQRVLDTTCNPIPSILL